MKGFSRVPCFLFLALAFAVKAAPPTIDPSQPADVTVNVASAADFSIVATNAVSYQWRLNGANVANATNATFALDDVTTSGTVDVIVTSPDQETITSRAAALTVVPGTIVILKISGYAANQSSNITIQLFDHDKPATVQNFIHYITSGAYTNMFFDRLITNFVLQGGDYGTTNRSNDDTPVEGDTDQVFSIDAKFVQNFATTPNLAFWVDNEFNDGPLIHNRFGTVAMAKKGGDPDSAENGFFFNLADNSTNLDNQNGGFTVFGRVTAGTNVLQYFNTLSKNGHGIFDESAVDSNPFLTDLPVNFSGFDAPVNTNLFYADFSFPSGFPSDTNPPVAVRTNMIVDTNTSDVQFFGTASDNLSLARVWGSVFSGTPFVTLGPIKSTGVTNWSMDMGVLPAGSNYTFTVSAQDGAGNSINVNYTFEVPAFPLRVSTNGRGTFTPTNAAVTNLSYLGQVTLKAKATPGSVFVGWTMGTNQGSLNPSFTVVNTNGGLVTANFITNNMPGNFHFTFPTAGAKLTDPRPTFTGPLAKTAAQPSQVITRIYSRTSKALLFTASTSNFVNNTWSIAIPELAPGLYTAQAIAAAPNGKGAVVYQNFDVLGALVVSVVGPGKTSLKTGTNYFEINTRHVIQAIPFAGATFHDLTGEGLERFAPVSSFAVSSGNSVESPLFLQATFFSNDVVKTDFTITSPKAGSTVFQPNVTVQGTLSGLTRVTCQAFTNNTFDEPTTKVIEATITGTNWNAVLPNLSPVSQKIVAIGYDDQGRTRMITETVTVNLLGTAVGVYNGLFFGVPETVDNSGMFTVTIKSNGAAGGRIQFPGVNLVYPINTRFPIAGAVEFSPGGFAGQNLLVVLGLFHSPGVIEGLIGQAAWSAQMFGYLKPDVLTASNSPAPGNYVLLFIPQNSTAGLPIAPGYGILTINTNGTFQLAGALSDDTTFSEGSATSSLEWFPIFSIPSGYGHKGMILGWQQMNTNSILDSQIGWVKGAVGGAYYTNGFPSVQFLTTSGGVAMPPTNGQYSIVFSGGTLTNSITNMLTFDSGQFQPNNNVTSINLETNGMILGQFTDPTGVSEPFKGAFVNPALGGAGYVAQVNQTNTAKFQLTASP